MELLGRQKNTCESMPLLRTFAGEGDQAGKTVAVFAVPNGGEDDFALPLFKQAVVRIVGFSGGAGDGAQFSFSARLPVSGKGYAISAALLFVAVIYLAATIVAGYSRPGFNPSPIQITAGMYGHASLSRLQIFLFSLIVAGLLLYTWLRTGELLDLSDNLLLLLGISAGGAAGAKFVAVVKKQPSMKVRAYLRRKGWLPADREGQAKRTRARDILLTDDKLNVYKFQAAAFSLVVGLTVVGSWFTGSAGFEIPNSVLALMGLSQGVYVGGKAISESNVKELETLLEELRTFEDDYLAVVKGAADDEKTIDGFLEHAPLQFDAYYKAAQEARMVFEDLYAIEVEDAKLLPKPV